MGYKSLRFIPVTITGRVLTSGSEQLQTFMKSLRSRDMSIVKLIIKTSLIRSNCVHKNFLPEH